MPKVGKEKQELKAKTKTKTKSLKTKAVKNPDYNRLALQAHKKMKGKLAIESKSELKTKDDWSTMYTPGVGAVSAYLAKNPKEARNYTIKSNTVAVISDGSAVLGLGNIGPLAALPVMEGKCAIFKKMANVDAFPIVLNTQDPNEIIAVVKAIAPTFGGINLEDIAAPKCFYVEEKLKAELDIPIMHDDQHGTAIVILAGLINASKVVKKKLEELKVVIVGAGAAGRATALLLKEAGIEDIVVTDSKGVIYKGRRGLDGYKLHLSQVTNPRRVEGDVMVAVAGADVIIGVSGPGNIAKAHIEAMAKDAIVFAMANPIPEIMPEDAKRAGATVVATGRSDFLNQVNNALVFPGIFRGALDGGVKEITDKMKLTAAKKIAGLVKKPTPEEIIPSVMNKDLVKVVASAVK